MKLEHRGISREDPLARKSHTRRREATSEEWMNGNLELAIGWEMMEIAAVLSMG